MPPDVLGGLVGVIGATSAGVLALVGLKIWFGHKYRMRGPPRAEDTERLTDAVEQLHDEVRQMREEFADLQERVDFTERMLSRGRSRDEIGPRESTPV